MRSLRLSLLSCVFVAAIPGICPALPVTITYSLAPGSINTLPTFVGGAAIEGMSATLLAQLPTLNAATPSGGVTLLSLKITGTHASTFKITDLQLSVASAYVYYSLMSSIPFFPFATQLSKFSFVFANLGGGSFYFTAFQSGNTTAPFTYFYAVVPGAEVGRVPEPSSGSLLLLGLAGIAGGSGALKRFRRQRRT